MDMNSILKKDSPVWSGIKVYFAGTGASLVLGLVMGLLVGAAKLGETAILYGAYIIGIPVIVYAAFLLYRAYSQEISALVTLIFMTIISAIISFSELLKLMSKNQAYIMVFATIIACVIGWYLAKQTKFETYLLGNKWILGFMVIGIVISFVSLLQFISYITA